MAAGLPAAAYIVPAVGAAVGGFFNFKGQSRAAKEQRTSSQAALEYQRGRDSIADQRYAARWDDYRQRYAAWEDLVRQRLGGGGGGSKPAGNTVTLWDLAGGGGQTGTSTIPQDAGSTFTGDVEARSAPGGRGTLGDLAAGDWGDWRRYYQVGG